MAKVRLNEDIEKNGFLELKHSNYHYVFFCPGCKKFHGFFVKKEGWSGATWDFNGNMENPTVQPSIKHTIGYGGNKPDYICHSFITDGKIQFCSDSTHELSNQTIDLPDLE